MVTLEAGIDSGRWQMLLDRMAAILDRYAANQQTLTYLELSNAIAIPGPARIHSTTRLLEELMAADLRAGRAIRAALVLSRSRRGLPAAGFFDHARRLGLLVNEDELTFHRRLVRDVFRAAGGHPACKAPVDGVED